MTDREDLVEGLRMPNEKLGGSTRAHKVTSEGVMQVANTFHDLEFVI